jgi:hypothetical protein
MESDLSTRTMGTDLPSPLVERRSVCGYHTRRICDTGSTSLCHARRLASTGWGVWLPAWRVRLCLIWFLPPLGHWADFRDLAKRGIILRLVEAHASVRDLLRIEGAEDCVGRIDRFAMVADVIEHFQKEGAQS